MHHIPVLLHEVISGLDLKPSDVFLDGTINGGGHSEAVAKLIGKEGMIIGTDLDDDALAKAAKRLEGAKARIVLRKTNFRNLDGVLKEIKVEAVDKILLDLGLSSNQFEESGRGFSFQKEEPLVMTFKKNPESIDLTAADIVNRWDEENIAQIIESYGEERFAKKIAHAIVYERERKEITTTKELADIIVNTVPKRLRHARLHPATKTFQALRITVNDEIGNLKEGLQKGFAALRKEGRMAVISFHSLEDRIVKNFFKQQVLSNSGWLITKKPLTSSREEVLENPRSRSAKLRIIKKVA